MCHLPSSRRRRCLVSNPSPKHDCMLVTMSPWRFSVLPSSPWIINAAVLERSMSGRLNNSKSGQIFSYSVQKLDQISPATACWWRGAPANRGHNPFLMIQINQSRGEIHGTLTSSIVTWLIGTSNVVFCFLVTRWTSLSEFDSEHLDHKLIPFWVATTSPTSSLTACAVKIWLLQVASERASDWKKWAFECIHLTIKGLAFEGNIHSQFHPAVIKWMRPRALCFNSHRAYVNGNEFLTYPVLAANKTWGYDPHVVAALWWAMCTASYHWLIIATLHFQGCRWILSTT